MRPFLQISKVEIVGSKTLCFADWPHFLTEGLSSQLHLLSTSQTSVFFLFFFLWRLYKWYHKQIRIYRNHDISWEFMMSDGMKHSGVTSSLARTRRSLLLVGEPLPWSIMAMRYQWFGKGTWNPKWFEQCLNRKLGQLYLRLTICQKCRSMTWTEDEARISGVHHWGARPSVVVFENETL